MICYNLLYTYFYKKNYEPIHTFTDIVDIIIIDVYIPYLYYVY